MDVTLTSGELARLRETISRVEQIRTFVCRGTPASEDVATWFAFLSALKALQGNANNDLSFLSCVLAKGYLVECHGGLLLDVATKPQGAPGLDIDVLTVRGERIVGEVKTVEPYLPTDFGSQQKEAFRADFKKLQSATAQFKYLFVSSRRAHEVLGRKYAFDLAGVTLVLLDATSSKA